MCQRSSQLQRERGNRDIQVVWYFLAVVALAAHTAHATSYSPWGIENEERGVIRKMLAHNIQKRSFFNIECRGVYDKVIFAQLDRVCEDCYNLFRESTLHSSCQSQCFTTDYFKGCVESLLMIEEMPKFRKMIEYLAK